MKSSKLPTGTLTRKKSKNIEFINFLNERAIGIAIITETHLKSEINVFLPDFRPIRLDRNGSAGGGVAIRARTNINCQMLPSFQLEFIESTVGPITSIAAYCSKQALSSDHYPVVAEVGSCINRHSVTRRNYHRDSTVDYDRRPNQPTTSIGNCDLLGPGTPHLLIVSLKA